MNDEYPPIFLAAAAGNLDTIREHGPNAPPEHRNQALAEAAALSQFDAADLLIEFGADPDGLYHENYGTVLFPACERLNPDGIAFLLQRGADPTRIVDRFDGARDALDHLMYSPHRSPLRARCIALLEQGRPQIAHDPVMAIHRESLSQLQAALEQDPDALTRPLDAHYGRYPLQNATLLHLATEYNLPKIARELLQRGLHPNTPAGDIPGTVNSEPIWPTQLIPLGKQTPIFHARESSKDMLPLLLEAGANPQHRAHFLRNGKPVQLTPLEFFQEIDNIECNLLEEILILRTHK